VSEPEWSLPMNRSELIARCEALEAVLYPKSWIINCVKTGLYRVTWDGRELRFNEVDGKSTAVYAGFPVETKATAADVCPSPPVTGATSTYSAAVSHMSASDSSQETITGERTGHGDPEADAKAATTAEPASDSSGFDSRRSSSPETVVDRCNCGWPRTTDGEHGDSCPAKTKGEQT
jgi:hypothetical protein